MSRPNLPADVLLFNNVRYDLTCLKPAMITYGLFTAILFSGIAAKVFYHMWPIQQKGHLVGQVYYKIMNKI